ETSSPKTGGGGGGGGGGGTPVITAPQTGAPTFAQAQDKIRSGDVDKGTEAELAGADANNVDQLVTRAEYYWLNYLKAERGKTAQAPLKADAEPVKKALADLNAAIAKKSADALFLRAQIHELTGNVKAAEADYRLGIKDFASDAAQKERFEAALL